MNSGPAGVVLEAGILRTLGVTIAKEKSTLWIALILKSLQLLRGGSMIVDDFPAVGEFAEDEGKAAVGSLAIGHG